MDGVLTTRSASPHVGRSAAASLDVEALRARLSVSEPLGSLTLSAYVQQQLQLQGAADARPATPLPGLRAEATIAPMAHSKPAGEDLSRLAQMRLSTVRAAAAAAAAVAAVTGPAGSALELDTLVSPRESFAAVHPVADIERIAAALAASRETLSTRSLENALHVHALILIATCTLLMHLRRYWTWGRPC